MSQYQSPQPAYAAAPPRGMSITSFVLGLVSLFFGFVFFLPLVGMILGFVGAKREPAGKGFATAGIIINGIILVGWVIVAIVIAATVGFGFLAALPGMSS